MADRHPRLFALPPGVSFAQELVRGFDARFGGLAPEEAAGTTIFLNTARMARRVHEAFVQGGARLIPRLRLVSDLSLDPWPGLPPAVPGLRRRLELARYVERLAKADGRLLQGHSLFELTESLAALMAEMHEEGIAPASLTAALVAGDHAEHWERSHAFIRLMAEWYLPEALPDAAARQRRAVERLVAAWEATPPSLPVIVAGSTGSRGTTAVLMEAASHLPAGHVVLPGYDFDLPGEVWACLDGDGHEDHPQRRHAATLARLGIAPDEVQRWTSAGPAAPGRNRAISLALRPAPVTDSWMREGGQLGDLALAMEGVTLLEAPSPRDEAIAIAAILRDAAGRGERAALVTPDRVLARRVTAALGRWGIITDDSAGEPLAQTAPGRLLRQIAALFGQKLPIAALLALLKHPLVCLGGDRGAHLLATRELELHLRRHGPAFVEAEVLHRWGEKADRAAWAAAVAAVTEARDAPPDAGIADWVARLLSLAERLGDGDRTGLWSGPAGRQSRLLLAALEREGPCGPTLSAEGFRDLLARSLATEGKRDPLAAHPLVAIWGTLEARVENAPLTILGGLNEGSWPEADSPDPWLSRPMRRAAGLRLPERTVGLAAHDFQQAAAAPRIVLSRSRRDSEAETVPSRWLARLTNLLEGLPGQSGPAVLAGMRARGEDWLALARSVEAPVPADPAPRPAPRPPVAARPRQLSVTDVRSLVRNPYHVYASKILRLRRLDPLSSVPDHRDRGKALHRVAERLVAERVAGEGLPEKMERLLRITDEVLAEDVPWLANRRLWRARFALLADRLAGSELRREAAGQAVVLEQGGRLYIPEIDLTLTARPDRIDQRPDGTVAIYDYKSSVPGLKEIKAYEHQLALEAEMALQGAFPGLDAQGIAELLYIGLGSAKSREEREVPLADTAAIWQRFVNLIRIYDRPETGYVARIYTWSDHGTEDFDDLSRFGEWDFEDPLDDGEVP